MKRLIGVALLSPSLLFGQAAEPSYTDIRVINGRKVDLAPVHQWYANPEGRERPLKHWAKLTILEIKPSTGGAYSQCLVETESGRQQILFKTLPAATAETVNKIQSLQTRIGSLQQEIAAEEPLVQQDEALYEGTVVRSSRLEVGPGLATRRYEYERPSRRAVGARFDRLALTEKKDLAAKLQEELTSLRQTTNANTILAMDTKRKYGGLPIWNMGIEGR
jgi:hypothetical protein